MSTQRPLLGDSRPVRLAILASGRGSNLQAVIDAIADGQLPVRIVGVFSDKPASGALARARGAGIPAIACSPKDFDSRAAHDEALFSQVATVQPDLIVCAGYMRLISEAAVRRFQGRMINIHPSLLPKYPGLDTHRRALEAGDAEHGASVHVVIPALDAGFVLAQTRIRVLSGDTPESLAQRMLPHEHALLVQTLAAICGGDLSITGENAHWRGQTLSSPLQLDDDKRLRGLN